MFSGSIWWYGNGTLEIFFVEGRGRGGKLARFLEVTGRNERDNYSVRSFETGMATFLDNLWVVRMGNDIAFKEREVLALKYWHQVCNDVRLHQYHTTKL